MKNKVLSCLGRRKRNSSHTEADFACGNGDAHPATRRGHRVGKLPRDEVVSAVGEHRAAPRCCRVSSGLDDDTESVQRAVNLQAAAGSPDASGLEFGEVCSGGCEEQKDKREDNDRTSRAMEDQRLGGSDEDRVESEGSSLKEGSRTSVLWITPDLDAERRTLCSLLSDQPLDCGLSNTQDHATGAKMTKTDCGAVSCPTKAAGDQKNSCPVEPETVKDSDVAPQSPSGGQSFPGTIPKLIITRDPSPNRSQGTPVVLTVRTDLSSGSCLEPHPDDESPCSDSGCGGSPALMRSPRKLSNSSSIGLSSASSFEESEDDFTGSDIESSLSPARSLCSPEDGTGVSVPEYFLNR